jgi:hypothetical protein
MRRDLQKKTKLIKLVAVLKLYIDDENAELLWSLAKR